MREDRYLENDSGGYSLLASEFIEAVLEDCRENDAQFVADHKIILQGLVGDDSFVVRVVVDEELSDNEREEWISRVVRPLEIPCGRLLISGGYDPDVIGDLCEDDSAFFNVPPGDYLVEILTYLNTMNGRVQREQWGSDGLLGHWFRHDHPDRSFPTWVVSELLLSPEEDPGHEQEWRNPAGAVGDGRLQLDLTHRSWIGVLVHLIPLSSDAKIDEPTMDGWFVPDAGLRRPREFPLGIPTTVDDHETAHGLAQIFPA